MLLNRYSLPRFAVASDSFGLSRPARSTYDPGGDARASSTCQLDLATSIDPLRSTLALRLTPNDQLRSTWAPRRTPNDQLRSTLERFCRRFSLVFEVTSCEQLLVRTLGRSWALPAHKFDRSWPPGLTPIDPLRSTWVPRPIPKHSL